ncbi:unnamed protein product [Schistosoma haematobium]|nr:unnamed protein product [Schistosoma haematobium]CAH8672961.1 unnamed protein product [Schistosoma haematobium]
MFRRSVIREQEVCISLSVKPEIIGFISLVTVATQFVISTPNKETRILMKKSLRDWIIWFQFENIVNIECLIYSEETAYIKLISVGDLNFLHVGILQIYN